MKNALTFLLFIVAGCTSLPPEKEKHIIPYNYKGYVTIFFNQPKGKEEKYDSVGRRVYEIDSDGVLVTKFSSNTGYFRDVENDILHYYDSLGTLIPIPLSVPDMVFDPATIVASTGSNGRYGEFVHEIYTIDSFKPSAPRVYRDGDEERIFKYIISSRKLKQGQQ